MSRLPNDESVVDLPLSHRKLLLHLTVESDEEFLERLGGVLVLESDFYVDINHFSGALERVYVILCRCLRATPSLLIANAPVDDTCRLQASALAVTRCLGFITLVLRACINKRRFASHQLLSALLTARDESVADCALDAIHALLAPAPGYFAREEEVFHERAATDEDLCERLAVLAETWPGVANRDARCMCWKKATTGALRSRLRAPVPVFCELHDGEAACRSGFTHTLEDCATLEDAFLSDAGCAVYLEFAPSASVSSIDEGDDPALVRLMNRVVVRDAANADVRSALARVREHVVVTRCELPDMEPSVYYMFVADARALMRDVDVLARACGWAAAPVWLATECVAATANVPAAAMFTLHTRLRKALLFKGTARTPLAAAAAAVARAAGDRPEGYAVQDEREGSPALLARRYCLARQLQATAACLRCRLPTRTARKVFSDDDVRFGEDVSCLAFAGGVVPAGSLPLHRASAEGVLAAAASELSTAGRDDATPVALSRVRPMVVRQSVVEMPHSAASVFLGQLHAMHPRTLQSYALDVLRAFGEASVPVNPWDASMGNVDDVVLTATAAGWNCGVPVSTDAWKLHGLYSTPSNGMVREPFLPLRRALQTCCALMEELTGMASRTAVAVAPHEHSLPAVIELMVTILHFVGERMVFMERDVLVPFLRACVRLVGGPVSDRAATRVATAAAAALAGAVEIGSDTSYAAAAELRASGGLEVLCQRVARETDAQVRGCSVILTHKVRNRAPEARETPMDDDSIAFVLPPPAIAAAETDVDETRVVVPIAEFRRELVAMCLEVVQDALSPQDGMAMADVSNAAAAGASLLRPLSTLWRDPLQPASGSSSVSTNVGTLQPAAAHPVAETLGAPLSSAAPTLASAPLSSTLRSMSAASAAHPQVCFALDRRMLPQLDEHAEHFPTDAPLVWAAKDMLTYPAAFGGMLIHIMVSLITDIVAADPSVCAAAFDAGISPVILHTLLSGALPHNTQLFTVLPTVAATLMVTETARDRVAQYAALASVPVSAVGTLPSMSPTLSALPARTPILASLPARSPLLAAIAATPSLSPLVEASAATGAPTRRRRSASLAGDVGSGTEAAAASAAPGYAALADARSVAAAQPGTYEFAVLYARRSMSAFRLEDAAKRAMQRVLGPAFQEDAWVATKPAQRVLYGCLAAIVDYTTGGPVPALWDETIPCFDADAAAQTNAKLWHDELRLFDAGAPTFAHSRHVCVGDTCVPLLFNLDLTNLSSHEAALRARDMPATERGWNRQHLLTLRAREGTTLPAGVDVTSLVGARAHSLLPAESAHSQQAARCALVMPCRRQESGLRTPQRSTYRVDGAFVAPTWEAEEGTSVACASQRTDARGMVSSWLTRKDLNALVSRLTEALEVFSDCASALVELLRCGVCRTVAAVLAVRDEYAVAAASVRSHLASLTNPTGLTAGIAQDTGAYTARLHAAHAALDRCLHLRMCQLSQALMNLFEFVRVVVRHGPRAVAEALVRVSIQASVWERWSPSVEPHDFIHFDPKTATAAVEASVPQHTVSIREWLRYTAGHPAIPRTLAGAGCVAAFAHFPSIFDVALLVNEICGMTVSQYIAACAAGQLALQYEVTSDELDTAAVQELSAGWQVLRSDAVDEAALLRMRKRVRADAAYASAAIELRGSAIAGELLQAVSDMRSAVAKANPSLVYFLPASRLARAAAQIMCTPDVQTRVQSMAALPVSCDFPDAAHALAAAFSGFPGYSWHSDLRINDVLARTPRIVLPSPFDASALFCATAALEPAQILLHANQSLGVAARCLELGATNAFATTNVHSFMSLPSGGSDKHANRGHAAWLWCATWQASLVECMTSAGAATPLAQQLADVAAAQLRAVHESVFEQTDVTLTGLMASLYRGNARFSLSCLRTFARCTLVLPQAVRPSVSTRDPRVSNAGLPSSIQVMHLTPVAHRTCSALSACMGRLADALGASVRRSSAAAGTRGSSELISLADVACACDLVRAAVWLTAADSEDASEVANLMRCSLGVGTKGSVQEEAVHIDAGYSLMTPVVLQLLQDGALDVIFDVCASLLTLAPTNALSAEIANELGVSAAASMEAHTAVEMLAPGQIEVSARNRPLHNPASGRVHPQHAHTVHQLVEAIAPMVCVALERLGTSRYIDRSPYTAALSRVAARWAAADIVTRLGLHPSAFDVASEASAQTLLQQISDVVSSTGVRALDLFDASGFALACRETAADVLRPWLQHPSLVAALPPAAAHGVLAVAMDTLPRSAARDTSAEAAMHAERVGKAQSACQEERWATACTSGMRPIGSNVLHATAWLRPLPLVVNRVVWDPCSGAGDAYAPIFVYTEGLQVSWAGPWYLCLACCRCVDPRHVGASIETSNNASGTTPIWYSCPQCGRVGTRSRDAVASIMSPASGVSASATAAAAAPASSSAAIPGPQQAEARAADPSSAARTARPAHSELVEGMISALTDMGFDRRAALRALRATGGLRASEHRRARALELAADFLVAHAVVPDDEDSGEGDDADEDGEDSSDSYSAIAQSVRNRPPSDAATNVQSSEQPSPSTAAVAPRVAPAGPVDVPFTWLAAWGASHCESFPHDVVVTPAGGWAWPRSAAVLEADVQRFVMKAVPRASASQQLLLATAVSAVCGFRYGHEVTVSDSAGSRRGAALALAVHARLPIELLSAARNASVDDLLMQIVQTATRLAVEMVSWDAARFVCAMQELSHRVREPALDVRADSRVAVALWTLLSLFAVDAPLFEQLRKTVWESADSARSLERAKACMACWRALSSFMQRCVDALLHTDTHVTPATLGDVIMSAFAGAATLLRHLLRTCTFVNAMRFRFGSHSASLFPPPAQEAGGLMSMLDGLCPDVPLLKSALALCGTFCSIQCVLAVASTTPTLHPVICLLRDATVRLGFALTFSDGPSLVRNTVAALARVAVRVRAAFCTPSLRAPPLTPDVLVMAMSELMALTGDDVVLRIRRNFQLTFLRVAASAIMQPPTESPPARARAKHANAALVAVAWPPRLPWKVFLEQVVLPTVTALPHTLLLDGCVYFTPRDTWITGLPTVALATEAASRRWFDVQRSGALHDANQHGLSALSQVGRHWHEDITGWSLLAMLQSGTPPSIHAWQFQMPCDVSAAFVGGAPLAVQWHMRRAADLVSTVKRLRGAMLDAEVLLSYCKSVVAAVCSLDATAAESARAADVKSLANMIHDGCYASLVPDEVSGAMQAAAESLHAAAMSSLLPRPSIHAQEVTTTVFAAVIDMIEQHSLGAVERQIAAAWASANADGLRGYESPVLSRLLLRALCDTCRIGGPSVVSALISMPATSAPAMHRVCQLVAAAQRPADAVVTPLSFPMLEYLLVEVIPYLVFDNPGATKPGQSSSDRESALDPRDALAGEQPAAWDAGVDPVDVDLAHLISPHQSIAADWGAVLEQHRRGRAALAAEAAMLLRTIVAVCGASSEGVDVVLASICRVLCLLADREQRAATGSMRYAAIIAVVSMLPAVVGAMGEAAAGYVIRHSGSTASSSQAEVRRLAQARLVAHGVPAVLLRLHATVDHRSRYASRVLSCITRALHECVRPDVQLAADAASTTFSRCVDRSYVYTYVHALFPYSRVFAAACDVRLAALQVSAGTAAAHGTGLSWDPPPTPMLDELLSGSPETADAVLTLQRLERNVRPLLHHENANVEKWWRAVRFPDSFGLKLRDVRVPESLDLLSLFMRCGVLPPAAWRGVSDGVTACLPLQTAAERCVTLIVLHRTRTAMYLGHLASLAGRAAPDNAVVPSEPASPRAGKRRRASSAATSATREGAGEHPATATPAAARRRRRRSASYSGGGIMDVEEEDVHAQHRSAPTQIRIEVQVPADAQHDSLHDALSQLVRGLVARTPALQLTHAHAPDVAQALQDLSNHASLSLPGPALGQRIDEGADDVSGSQRSSADASQELSLPDIVFDPNASSDGSGSSVDIEMLVNDAEDGGESGTSDEASELEQSVSGDESASSHNDEDEDEHVSAGSGSSDGAGSHDDDEHAQDAFLVRMGDDDDVDISDDEDDSDSGADVHASESDDGRTLLVHGGAAQLVSDLLHLEASEHPAHDDVAAGSRDGEHRDSLVRAIDGADGDFGIGGVFRGSHGSENDGDSSEESSASSEEGGSGDDHDSDVSQFGLRVSAADRRTTSLSHRRASPEPSFHTSVGGLFDEVEEAMLARRNELDGSRSSAGALCGRPRRWEMHPESPGAAAPGDEGSNMDAPHAGAAVQHAVQQSRQDVLDAFHDAMDRLLVRPAGNEEDLDVTFQDEEEHAADNANDADAEASSVEEELQLGDGGGFEGYDGAAMPLARLLSVRAILDRQQRRISVIGRARPSRLHGRRGGRASHSTMYVRSLPSLHIVPPGVGPDADNFHGVHSRPSAAVTSDPDAAYHYLVADAFQAAARQSCGLHIAALAMDGFLLTEQRQAYAQRMSSVCSRSEVSLRQWPDVSQQLPALDIAVLGEPPRLAGATPIESDGCMDVHHISAWRALQRHAGSASSGSLTKLSGMSRCLTVSKEMQSQLGMGAVTPPLWALYTALVISHTGAPASAAHVRLDRAALRAASPDALALVPRPITTNSVRPTSFWTSGFTLRSATESVSSLWRALSLAPPSVAHLAQCLHTIVFAAPAAHRVAVAESTQEHNTATVIAADASSVPIFSLETAKRLEVNRSTWSTSDVTVRVVHSVRLSTALQVQAVLHSFLLSVSAIPTTRPALLSPSALTDGILRYRTRAETASATQMAALDAVWRIPVDAVGAASLADLADTLTQRLPVLGSRLSSVKTSTSSDAWLAWPVTPQGVLACARSMQRTVDGLKPWGLALCDVKAIVSAMQLVRHALMTGTVQFPDDATSLLRSVEQFMSSLLEFTPALTNEVTRLSAWQPPFSVLAVVPPDTVTSDASPWESVSSSVSTGVGVRRSLRLRSGDASPVLHMLPQADVFVVWAAGSMADGTVVHQVPRESAEAVLAAERTWRSAWEEAQMIATQLSGAFSDGLEEGVRHLAAAAATYRPSTSETTTAAQPEVVHRAAASSSELLATSLSAALGPFAPEDTSEAPRPASHLSLLMVDDSALSVPAASPIPGQNERSQPQQRERGTAANAMISMDMLPPVSPGIPSPDHAASLALPSGDWSSALHQLLPSLVNQLQSLPFLPSMGIEARHMPSLTGDMPMPIRLPLLASEVSRVREPASGLPAAQEDLQTDSKAQVAPDGIALTDEASLANVLSVFDSAGLTVATLPLDKARALVEDVSEDVVAGAVLRPGDEQRVDVRALAGLTSTANGSVDPAAPAREQDPHTVFSSASVHVADFPVRPSTRLPMSADDRLLQLRAFLQGSGLRQQPSALELAPTDAAWLPTTATNSRSRGWTQRNDAFSAPNHVQQVLRNLLLDDHSAVALARDGGQQAAGTPIIGVRVGRSAAGALGAGEQHIAAFVELLSRGHGDDIDAAVELKQRVLTSVREGTGRVPVVLRLTVDIPSDADAAKLADLAVELDLEDRTSELRGVHRIELPRAPLPSKDVLQLLRMFYTGVPLAVGSLTQLTRFLCAHMDSRALVVRALLCILSDVPGLMPELSVSGLPVGVVQHPFILAASGTASGRAACYTRGGTLPPRPASSGDAAAAAWPAHLTAMRALDVLRYLLAKDARVTALCLSPRFAHPVATPVARHVVSHSRAGTKRARDAEDAQTPEDATRKTARGAHVSLSTTVSRPASSDNLSNLEALVLSMSRRSVQEDPDVLSEHVNVLYSMLRVLEPVAAAYADAVTTVARERLQLRALELACANLSESWESTSAAWRRSLSDVLFDMCVRGTRVPPAICVRLQKLHERTVRSLWPAALGDLLDRGLFADGALLPLEVEDIAEDDASESLPGDSGGMCRVRASDAHYTVSVRTFEQMLPGVANQVHAIWDECRAPFFVAHGQAWLPSRELWVITHAVTACALQLARRAPERVLTAFASALVRRLAENRATLMDAGQLWQLPTREASPACPVHLQAVRRHADPDFLAQFMQALPAYEPATDSWPALPDDFCTQLIAPATAALVPGFGFQPSERAQDGTAAVRNVRDCVVDVRSGAVRLWWEPLRGYACPLCVEDAPKTIQYMDRGDVLRHCMRYHSTDMRHATCPLCSYSPGGKPEYRSHNFTGHLRLRHGWSFVHNGCGTGAAVPGNAKAQATNPGSLMSRSRSLLLQHEVAAACHEIVGVRDRLEHDVPSSGISPLLGAATIAAVVAPAAVSRAPAFVVQDAPVLSAATIATLAGGLAYESCQGTTAARLDASLRLLAVVPQNRAVLRVSLQMLARSLAGKSQQELLLLSRAVEHAHRAGPRTALRSASGLMSRASASATLSGTDAYLGHADSASVGDGLMPTYGASAVNEKFLQVTRSLRAMMAASAVVVMPMNGTGAGEVLFAAEAHAGVDVSEDGDLDGADQGIIARTLSSLLRPQRSRSEEPLSDAMSPRAPATGLRRLRQLDEATPADRVSAAAQEAPEVDLTPFDDLWRALHATLSIVVRYEGLRDTDPHERLTTGNAAAAQTPAAPRLTSHHTPSAASRHAHHVPHVRSAALLPSGAVVPQASSSAAAPQPPAPRPVKAASDVVPPKMMHIVAHFAPLIVAFFQFHRIDLDAGFVGSSADPNSTKTRSREPEPARKVHVPAVDDALLARIRGGAGTQPDVPADAPVITAPTPNRAESSDTTARFASGHAMQRRVMRFVEDHREVLNAAVRLEPGLLNDMLLPMLANRDCRTFLDFGNKQGFFRAQLRELHSSRSSSSAVLHVNVRRQHVFSDSYGHFAHLTAEQLRGRLEVRFKGEEGVDAGGLTREWYEILARDMFNPGYALFMESEDGTTFQPNPNSGVNEEHLLYFKFVGRIIAKAVADGQLLDAHFTRSFYKHMLGVPVTYHDIEAIDPQFYKSLNDILGMSIDDLGLELTFSAEQHFGGDMVLVDLVPGGRDIAVTDSNKWEYVQLIAAHKMTSSIRLQIDAFLSGFHDIIPPSLISLFSESELELLIAGLPSIDIADLRANTDYTGYRPNDESVLWFWSAVESFDEQDRARLLMFVTGTSKVPLGGFKSLRGQRGPHKFTIEKSSASPESLPTSHTCFNTLTLPCTYHDAEELREKLIIAIREGSEGFGMI